MSSILTLAGNNTSDASFYPHTIDQSLRFEDGDSAHLSRNPDTNSTNGRNLNTTSFWVKRGNLGSTQMMYAVGSSFPTNHNDSSVIQFLSDDTLRYRTESAGSATSQLDTTRVFRDVSSWYHIHLIFDRDNSTEADRLRLYINGVRETVFDSANYPTTSQNSQFTNNKLTYIGRSTANYFDGYIAEFVSIDSAAVSHDSFGELKDGIWVPKNVSGLTFGQNGFHLTFEATGTATTAQDTTAQTNIGDDQSGLGNNFAVSGLVASDVVLDSPTNTFATLNNVHPNASSGNFSEGNLRSYQDQTPYTDFYATFAVSSGKWYWEGRAASTAVQQIWGFAREDALVTGDIGSIVAPAGYTYYRYGNISRERANGSYTNSSGTLSVAAGDIIGLALNLVDNEVKFYKNGTLEHTITGVQDGTYYPFVCYQQNQNRLEQRVNFGQDSTFAGVESAGGNSDDNGIGDFAQSPISEHLAICSANLPEPAIIDGSEYFNTVLYTGNGGTQSITGVNFESNFTWIKRRDSTNWHMLYDSVRGAGKSLNSNETNAEFENTTRFTSFDSDGFTVGNDANTNSNTRGYVSWNWLAGTAVSGNTTGSGTAKVYSGSVNTKAGFSIITYKGNGTAGHTIPHNLTVGGVATAPTMVIFKNRDIGDQWAVYHKDILATHNLCLNNTDGNADQDNRFNDTEPTDSVMTLGTGHVVNATDEDYIAYFFTDIDQYCKAGVYSGNSSADGAYVHTGFAVSWLMVKSTSSGTQWMIYDNKRLGYNVDNNALTADDSATEKTDNDVDLLSNGFKWRRSSPNFNQSSYIYLAFAEQPAKYSNAR